MVRQSDDSVLCVVAGWHQRAFPVRTLVPSVANFAIPFSGIVGYADGLIIVSSAGGLFYHDLELGNTTEIASPNVTGVSGDGMVIDGDRLYVNQNALNQLSVYDLAYDSDTRNVTADLFGYITSDLYDAPSTSAQYNEWIYSVNARFSIGFPADGEGNLTTFAEEFDVVAVMKSDVVEV
jgi:hypothetical protein